MERVDLACSFLTTKFDKVQRIDEMMASLRMCHISMFITHAASHGEMIIMFSVQNAACVHVHTTTPATGKGSFITKHRVTKKYIYITGYISQEQTRIWYIYYIK